MRRQGEALPRAWEPLARPAVAGFLLLVGLLSLTAATHAVGRHPDARRSLRPQPLELRVDVNRAEVAELELLPGIGPALAGRILEYRERFGPFNRVGHLTRVSGIGPKTLARIRPWVRLNSGSRHRQP